MIPKFYDILYKISCIGIEKWQHCSDNNFIIFAKNSDNICTQHGFISWYNVDGDGSLFFSDVNCYQNLSWKCTI